MAKFTPVDYLVGPVGPSMDVDRPAPLPTTGSGTNLTNPITLLLKAAGALVPDAPAQPTGVRTRLPHVEIEHPGQTIPDPNVSAPTGPVPDYGPQGAVPTMPPVPAAPPAPAMPVAPMAAPAANPIAPTNLPPINDDLFGRFIRAGMRGTGLAPDQADRAAGVFRLFADKAWRENSLAGSAVSDYESGRGLLAERMGPDGRLYRPTPDQLPPDQREVYVGRQNTYNANRAEKEGQQAALGKLSPIEQGLAIISSIVGSALSPESAAGPGGTMYRTASVGSKILQGAGINAAVVGATDPLAQSAAVERGDKQAYSPAEHAMATGGAALLGGLIPAIGALFRRGGALREAPPVEPPKSPAQSIENRDVPSVKSEAPPARPAEAAPPAQEPMVKVAPGVMVKQEPAQGVEAVQGAVKDSLARMDERMGVRPQADSLPPVIKPEPEKPATQAAIAEAPRAPVEPPKAQEPVVQAAPAALKEPAIKPVAEPPRVPETSTKAVDKINAPGDKAGMETAPVRSAETHPIIRELDEIETMKRERKRHSMVYQAEEKRAAAKADGLEPEAYYNLPYEQWREISHRHYAAWRKENGLEPVKPANQPTVPITRTEPDPALVKSVEDIPEFMRRPIKEKEEPRAPSAPEPVKAPEAPRVEGAPKAAPAQGEVESPFKAIAQRQVNARENMIETLMERGGIDRAQAETALDAMVKAKAIKLDSVNGRYNVKHGAFMERDAIRRAAGLADEAPKPVEKQIAPVENRSVSEATVEPSPKAELEIGKEATYSGRKTIEIRARDMDGTYVVEGKPGAKALEESWVVQRKTYDMSSKYGKDKREYLTPYVTKKEALEYAKRAARDELDAAGREGYTPLKFTSPKFVQPGDVVLAKHGDVWRLARVEETDYRGVVTRADVNGEKIELAQGQSYRLGDDAMRPRYDDLMKRHGKKTWEKPADAADALRKWRDGPGKAEEVKAKREAAAEKPTHPFTDTDAQKTELHAGIGTNAIAKAAGPETVGALVGGMVDHWEEHGRLGLTARGMIGGALAVAALRHRLPGLSKSIVGKDSFATGALKGLGDAAASTKAGRWFHPRMGVEQELWDKLVKLKVETRNFQDDALKIAKLVRENTTADERILISDWIERRDLEKHGINTWTAADEKVKGIADALVAHVDGLGERLTKVGMLDRPSFDALRGEYLHRYYLPKMEQDPGFKQAAARMKASASYALRRGETAEGVDGVGKVGETVTQWTHARSGEIKYAKDAPSAEWIGGKEWKVERVSDDGRLDLHRDYTPQERQRMGEIRDANYRFAMGSMEASRDLALGTMFQQIARDTRWASASPKDGWVLVPNTAVGQGSAVKKWGELAGKHVAPEVWDALKIVRKPWSPDELGAMGGIMNGYLKALGMWKVGKTAYNPATHFNNVMGNVSLAALTGEVGPVHLMKAIGALRRKDPVIEEARRAGLSLGREANLGDTFDGVKIDVGLASGLDPRSGWAKFADWWTNNAIVRAYQAEDSVFKLGAYMRRRAAGETPDQAVANVHKVFFDYSDVPLGVQAVRDFYSPFFTYTYKYAQVMARELAERPHRFLAAFGILTAMNQMSYDWLYGDRAKAVSDYEREMAPKWLQGRSGFGAEKAIRLPWNKKDDQTGENRALMLNTRYMVPGGDMLDFVANGDFGPSVWPQALGNTLLGGNPLVNTAFGLATGKDTFFNKPLYPYPDTNLWDIGKRPAGEIAANWGAAIRFMATQALPPTLFAAPDKIGQAAVGEGAIDKGGPLAEFMGWTGTDFVGRQKSITRAVASVLGVKVEDVAPDEAKKFREHELAKEVRDNLANARKLHGNQSTTETRKENAKDSLMDRVGRFQKETRKIRDLQEKAGAR